MKKEYYIELIIAKLNGNIEENQAAELSEWINSEPENLALFKETKKIWTEADLFEPIIDSNKNNIWDSIQNEIDAEEVKVIPIKKPFSLYKIAATLLLLICSASFLTMYLNSDETTIIITGNNEKNHIELPDGSQIDLNENSKLSYSKKFNKREVTLKGEAFFAVAENKDKPFVVAANHTKTMVLGTSFNIKTKANYTKVSLYTGKVKFVAPNQDKILLPGESVVYEENKDLAFLQRNNNNDKAWLNNTLVFKNDNLKQVIEDIKAYYKLDIKIDLSNNCTFTGTFKEKEINEVLESISYSFDSKYTLNNNTAVFESINCNE